MIVVKYGGTSLAGTERMRASARIVAAHRRDQSVVCVVSAMAGVTDALITTIEQAISGDTAWQTSITEISARHQTTMDELMTTTGSIPTITTRFATAIAALKADLQRILVAEFATEEARAHAIAAFSGWGERLSVLLFAQALAGEDVAVTPFDGEPVVMVERQSPGSGHAHGRPGIHEADSTGRTLAPSVAATRELLTSQMADWERLETVPVLPGYLGRTRYGLSTTLGRNGSDYSAAVIGAALHADAVYLYSNVAGVHRADPRFVPDADVLPVLTYADAAEAAGLGARILHPATLRPLAAAGIPLRLRSAFDPSEQGTDVGPARLFPQADLELSNWVVTAHALSADQQQRDAHGQGEPGLVEVTGLFFRHAELDAYEDDHLADAYDELSVSGGEGAASRNDGPVSGALALLTAPPLPVSLALTARRISVSVPVEESAATQRRLYSALAHADARAGRKRVLASSTERRRTS